MYRSEGGAPGPAAPDALKTVGPVALGAATPLDIRRTSNRAEPSVAQLRERQKDQSMRIFHPGRC